MCDLQYLTTKVSLLKLSQLSVRQFLVKAQANLLIVTTATYNTSKRSFGLFLLIGLVLLMVTALSICLGSLNFSLREVLQALLGNETVNTIHRQIIVDFRLPQVVTALLSGAALGRTAYADSLS